MNNFMKVAAVGLLTGYTACQAFVCPAGQHLSSAVCRGASSSSAATLSMVAKGDVVTVDLQVKDAKTGKPFESTFDQGQVRFVVGGGGFLPAIHKAVERMQVGEAKELELSGDDAYGDADEALIATLPLDQAPPNLQRGQVLRLWTGQKARVTDVTADAFTLDMNRLGKQNTRCVNARHEQVRKGERAADDSC
eukprot:TRINITY_DN9797_c0_g1_i3.p1 TRINITY_DN9797_c0_g1~~TRINITY_DN9797_c0_g1_i3.p1  ORF type:complete len:193 (-),score=50.41 TRINITY_DN9797_c0_g1_i3:390-968(-)